MHLTPSYFCLSLLVWTSGFSFASEETCMRQLTARRGIIATPNFPRAFDVPIKCRWVIDASNLPVSANGSIVIYLTQLYVYKGLRITEYSYYESERVNYAGKLVIEITEGNVFDFQRYRSSEPYLVLDFELDRLEGNHVRVLYDLLDVYGFNITYEITEEKEHFRSCSVKDCSYAGNCLLSSNYRSFYCDCFESFSGEHCGEGPLCSNDQKDSVCKNGGVCRHVGAKAVRCSCPDNFTGNACEIPVSKTKDSDCNKDECILQCPFHGSEQSDCQCKDGTRIYNNRSRYECKIKLSNVSALHHTDGGIQPLLDRQLTEYLKSSNINSMEDLTVLSVSSSSEVSFYFFANTNDGGKIREALNRLVERRRLNKIALEPTHFTFQQKPALRLESLQINHGNEHEVRLGDRFILTCKAQGSYGLNFTWYKDNMLVNTSRAIRDIWYRNSPNEGSDSHTSLLTIEQATLLDTGQYTCQVVDWGVQQCKSIHVEVKDEPNVKIIPMSATVQKDSDIQLICTTPNMLSNEIGFGWTKNRALLKLEPGSEVWEDLYPAGSILKISKAQKSSVYTCNVAHRSTSVRVEVVNRSAIPICPEEEAWDLKWPETAPGSSALLDCPRNFVGPSVSRICAMKDATTPEWQVPDFSACLYEPLVQPYNSFRSGTLGYQSVNEPTPVRDIWDILRQRNSRLYPGEADRLLNILAEIEHYQRNIGNFHDLTSHPENLVHLLDWILNNSTAIFDRQKLLLLNLLMRQSLFYWSQRQYNVKHLALSSLVIDMATVTFNNTGSGRHFQVPSDHRYPNWYNDSLALRLHGKQIDLRNATVMVVVYKNIHEFISEEFIKITNEDSDFKHKINSHVITVGVSSNSPDEDNVWVDLQFRHLVNLSSSINASCGFLEESASWKLDLCTGVNINVSTTHCLCPKTGTFALFFTTRRVKEILVHQELITFVEIFGCGLGLLQCLLTLIISTFFWFNNRTWLNFLKIQCCGAIAAAMAVFTYAMYNYLANSLWPIVAVTLEAFLFVGMSAPISQALIIYAEFTHVRPSQHFQPTVIALITGVPVLSLLATELTHQSTGLSHESWWLIFGSGVYNIFVTCTTVMLLIFVLLYIGVLHKSHGLAKRNCIKNEKMKTRVRMLHRAAIIICGIIAMEASSIIYINSTTIVFHYVFASFSSLLGFVILMMYVIASEHPFIKLFKKIKKKEELEEHISEPIKVGAEVENDTAPTLADMYLESRGVACGSLDLREFDSETVISGSYLKSSVPPTKRYLPEIRVDSDEINLETYQTSPRKYHESRFDSRFSCRKVAPPVFAPSAEPLTKIERCIGFCDYPAAGLICSVGPLQSAPVCALSSTVSIECPMGTKVLCNAEVEPRFGVTAMPDVTLAVNSEPEIEPSETFAEMKARGESGRAMPDIAHTSERKQPEGQEKLLEKSSSSPPPAPPLPIDESSTSGMLDRISHDLDYLLNRTHSGAEDT